MTVEEGGSLVYELMPELAGYEEYPDHGLCIGVVGFGKMGILHSGILNLLRPGCVRGVVDRSRLLVFGASRILREVTFYRDLDEMLREMEPDVVYVTTPTQTHFDIVSRLLKAGIRYIFVEKPPTRDSAELSSLKDEMDREQLVMVGFQKRFALPFRHLRMMVEEKALGEVEKVYAYIRSSDILQPTNRFDSQGRGVLLDLGIHLVDLLLWLFDANLVEASECNSLHSGVDDEFRAELRAEDGVEIGMEADWSSPGYRLPETYIEVHASEGVLRATEDYLKVQALEGHPLLKDGRELVMHKPHYYRGVPPVNLADPEYTLENIHFLHSIHSSTEPLTSLGGVAETMELVDELYLEAGI